LGVFGQLGEEPKKIKPLPVVVIILLKIKEILEYQLDGMVIGKTLRVCRATVPLSVTPHLHNFSR
jgi:hypothetical protein